MPGAVDFWVEPSLMLVGRLRDCCTGSLAVIIRGEDQDTCGDPSPARHRKPVLTNPHNRRRDRR